MGKNHICHHSLEISIKELSVGGTEISYASSILPALKTNLLVHINFAHIRRVATGLLQLSSIDAFTSRKGILNDKIFTFPVEGTTVPSIIPPAQKGGGESKTKTYHQLQYNSSSTITVKKNTGVQPVPQQKKS